MKTIITIGSGYSGSSAIYEFLQKMKKFHDPFPNQEFSLTYDPGGIMDIENCILNKSTINQNNYVYEQFKKNILYYLNKVSSLKPGKEFKSYNFEKLSLEYLNSIISLKYEGESLFSKHKKNILKNFFSKFMFRLFKSKSSSNSILFKDYNEFTKNTEIFFNKLFMQEGHLKDIILDQGGIFTNPFGSTKFFNNSHCILVYRDPRDIYSEFKTKTLSAFPKKDVLTFCTWYENIMNKINVEESNRPNMLNLNFEDFILKNQDILKKISKHISLPLSDFQKVEFDFERSKKNIFKFKNILNSEENKTIEKKLEKYLYSN
jgi:hypothetical protein